MASLCNFSPTALGDAEDLCQHLLAPGQNHKHKQTNQTKKKGGSFPWLVRAFAASTTMRESCPQRQPYPPKQTFLQN